VPADAVRVAWSDELLKVTGLSGKVCGPTASEVASAAQERIEVLMVMERGAEAGL
jgi:hypothetical protein